MKTSTILGLAARPRLRAMMFLALSAVLVLSLSVPAMALTQVNLHGPHVGANSETFNTEGDDGGLTDAVVWHFVLNGLDSGTDPATIYVTFASAGAKTAVGIPVGAGKTQHFYIGTPTHDTIVSAYAMVDSEGFNNLVLSHVALNDVAPPVEPPPVEPPPTDNETPTVEPPVVEPPAEEPPAEMPPAEEPPAEAPPVIEDDDPFLPFTEEPVAPVVKEESEPFLPYTGIDFGALSMLAGASAALGAGLRKLGLR